MLVLGFGLEFVPSFEFEFEFEFVGNLQFVVDHPEVDQTQSFLSHRSVYALMAAYR